jgi:ubiquinone/menaquinone biosynthesis C-methylase UbiE
MDVIPRNWYENWFGNEYLTLYAHRDKKEARKLINLVRQNINLKPDAQIIDLCCGQGRHAHILAELGYHVVGVDLSKTLLEVAKFKHSSSGKAKFVQSDMRLLPFNHSFDLLLNLFTSFGYFDSDIENQCVFTQFRRVLKNDGWFVFDYINDKHVRDNLVESQNEKIGNIMIELKRYISHERVQKKITMTQDRRKSIFYESVKMYPPDKIEEMMLQADLKIHKMLGDYDGSPFLPDSPRLIIIGSKQ